MRALILGAGGMLGYDLVRSAPEGTELHPLTRHDLDITDRAALAARVSELRPNVILNAAAYTGVDRAETERNLCFRVNGEAVGELGRSAARTGARVVHFSTDYVFDGKASRPYQEDTPTKPVNAYGESKLAGEKALAETGADWLIVRTQWLFGVNGKSFPRTMWERAHAGLETRVVRDQTGRPTFSHDLAVAVWALIARGTRGVMHVANDGQSTWFDVAAHVFARAGRPDLLSACSTADFPTPARRPTYSVLDTHLAEQLGGNLPPWPQAVDRFLEDLRR
ncbi:MAG TPA: dTDP-4-dehydrorhamnose reductase [Gemmatimonadales bacterium]|nr:dTDP-4-dehydrorhamnose reductase [Gemmatimonadales bacterium]